MLRINYSDNNFFNNFQIESLNFNMKAKNANQI